ncbi:uncharacterized protein METZ01_LOCUS446935, partial [marine metagenome]
LFGKRADGWGYFNGKLTNISIWNRLLDEGEIQSNMYSELAGNELDLIGYWNLKEGSGNVLYDHSGNGNHGIIHGASWVEYCQDDFIPNCNPNYDGADVCCPDSWIGDGFADCADQAYNCDLTCYDNDGGDCGSFCGDDICDEGETNENCSDDCESGEEYWSGPVWYVSNSGFNANNGSETSPFFSIQNAINIAEDGDTIYVQSGHYTENLYIANKGIFLIGEHRESTVIDGNQWGSVIRFEGDDSTKQALVSNFSIT